MQRDKEPSAISNLLSSDQPKMFPSYKTFFTPSYQEDFGNKTAQRVQCIRTGSSSGNRRNNPHPPHAFMVWRYPRKQFLPDHMIDDPSAPIPPINLACPNTNIASTYQVDFERPTTRAQALSSQPSSSGCHTTAEPLSTQGWSFQPPKLSRRLRGNTTRYGCSQDKIKPACGAVPTISARECNLFSNQDTSYSESYQPQTTCQLPKIPPSVSRRPQQRGSNGSGAGKRSLYQPSWLSQWTGPS